MFLKREKFIDRKMAKLSIKKRKKKCINQDKSLIGLAQELIT
jgi:hypothetical protein